MLLVSLLLPPCNCVPGQSVHLSISHTRQHVHKHRTELSYYIKSIDGTWALLASGTVRGRMYVYINLQYCLLQYFTKAVSGTYRVGQVLEEKLGIRVDVIVGNSERRKRRIKEMT